MIQWKKTSADFIQLLRLRMQIADVH